MSTAGRPAADAPAPSDVAARLREAGLVGLVGHAGGDGLAGTALLGRALADVGTPIHARIGAYGTRAARTDADLTVGLGRPDRETDVTLGATGPASAEAFAVAGELGAADPVLAGAGVRAAGATPTDRLADALATAGVDRRPGLAIPGTDLREGLAFSTQVHGPFSGDVDAADRTLSRRDAAEDREVASLVALATIESGATARGAGALGRLLRPYEGGPLATLGGYGDVLGAAAHRCPGRGLSVALGDGDPDALREDWREHGRAVHGAVADATPDGPVATAEVDRAASPATVARLVVAHRSCDVALVRGPDTTVVRSAADGPTVMDAASRAADDQDGAVAGKDRHVGVTVDDPTAFAAALREAMA